MAKKIVIGDCFLYNGITLVMTEETEDSYHLEANGKRGHYWRKESFSKNHDALPTLHLPIGNDVKKYGGAWFDMILSGEKTEEYRAWSRFYANLFCSDSEGIFADDKKTLIYFQPKTWKPWKVVHLTNGYGHDKPQLWAHIETITTGNGRQDWGAPADWKVFIIKLGEIFHTKNIKK